MANDITVNPWKLDTAGSGVIYSHGVRIRTIIWTLPVAQGDDLAITDRNDKPIITAKAEAAGQTQIFRLGDWYEGLKLTVLDSGTVTVHIR